MSVSVADLRRSVGTRIRDQGARRRVGRSRAVGALTPILPGKGFELEWYLRGLGTGDDSPFARVPDVHFARWVIIDRLKTAWPGAPRPRPRLRSEYLLFTADVTAPDHVDDPSPRWFFRELYLSVPEEVTQVWGHCRGSPCRRRIDDWVQYLYRARVDPSLYYVAFPNVTVGEVRQALRARDRHIEFARGHQGPRDWERVRAEYLERYPGWSRST